MHAGGLSIYFFDGFVEAIKLSEPILRFAR